MNDVNSWIPFEVIAVESEDAGNAVNGPGGHKPRIIDLWAGHGMGNNQTTPLAVDGRGVTEQR